MSRPYLLDENLSATWRAELLRHEPALVVWAVGDPEAPGCGTPDPDVLIRCEARGARLVTNNRKSMPGHLADHLAAGRHVPGIFVVPDPLPSGAALDHLLLIALAGRPDDYRDEIVRLPFPTPDKGR